MHGKGGGNGLARVAKRARSQTMFDFRPDPCLSTPERHRQLHDAIDAVTSGEPDGVANMANAAALIAEFLPDLNWAGFYRVSSSEAGSELILGPFIGRPACIRIAMGSGVCGTAAESKQYQLVDDVEAFPGHIACDGETKSELVVPVIRSGEVIAVIDLDSPLPARFTREDAMGLERIAQLLANRI